VTNADGTNPVRLTRSEGGNGHASFSTDGSIYFTSGRGGNQDVWVMNADGSDQRRLTTADGPDGAPEISPDGRVVSFYTERDGNPELYLMNPDGTNQRNLTQGPDTVYESSWSPAAPPRALHPQRRGPRTPHTPDPERPWVAETHHRR